MRDILIGESLVGDGNEVAHIDLIIGPKSGPVGYAFAQTLVSPRMGHTALLAVLEPNLIPKPAAVIVNKVTIKGADQAVLMFGPAQAAVAKAVADCVEAGTIPKVLVEDIVAVVGVFIHWDAKDKKKIYDWNYQATKEAIERAMKSEPSVDTVLAKKNAAKHPFA